MRKPSCLFLGLAFGLALLPAWAAGPAPDLVAINDLQQTPLLRQGSRGPAVLRAQVLLDRQHFSPGELDGHYGSNVATAVRGFQRSRKLPATGEVDASTWHALLQDARPVLQAYVIDPIDLSGPFFPIPDDMMDKAQLLALVYENALEALGEKFHSAPTLLRQLNPDAGFNRVGETIWVPHLVPAAPLPPIARLIVDRSELTVMLLDAQGKVQAQFPATIGSERDPLPEGDWTIKGVARNPPFHYNPALFWDADPQHAKAKLPPGPNSPVGVVWVDLSKEHYGLHGTPEPALIGKTQSHGCIRLTNWDALRVADAVRPGLPARLQP